MGEMPERSGKREKKESGKELLVWIGLVAAGLVLFFVIGERRYVLANDSMGYIHASYEREPLYPLLLMLFKRLFGARYLDAAAAVQSAAALGVCLYAAYFFRKQFCLNRIEWVLFAFLLMMPFCLDSMWSKPRVNFAHYIITDSLSYTLFYLFVVRLLSFLRTRRFAHYLAMAVLTMLMVLNRSQMQVCYLVMPAAAVLVFAGRLRDPRENKRRTGLFGGGCIAGLLLTVVLTSAFSYLYCYVMWGDFARSSENDFSMLTNLLYASDEEDAELFEGEQRAAFESLYAQADALGYTYQHAQGAFFANGMHMMACHDPIKYGLIRPYFREYIASKGLEESFASDHVKKELASALKTKLLKKHGFRWIYNGLCMMPYGLILAAAPVIVPGYEWISYGLAAVVWAAALAMLIALLFALRGRKKTGTCAGFAACILFFILLNTASCSMIIMVSSRYLNYTQGLFYIVLYLLVRELLLVTRKGSGKAAGCPERAG